MAKIQLGAIVTDIRGKLNGHAFRKATSGLVIQRCAVPRSKDFYEKNSQLQTLKYGAQQWNNLPANQRKLFADFARANPLKNEFGNSYVISGRAMAQKLYPMVKYVWEAPLVPFTLSNELQNVIYEQDFENPYFLDYQSTIETARVLVRFEVRSGRSPYFSFRQVKRQAVHVVNTASGAFDIKTILNIQQKAIADDGWLFIQLVEVNRWGWSGMKQNFTFFKGLPYVAG